jgi:predicted nucleotidyltransferase
LTVPLQSLIPTVDAAALTVLGGTEGALGQSQIQRLAPRGSRRGLVLALERLAANGLVIAEPTNHGHVYRLNREHLLAAPVLAAAGARREFLERLAEACAQLEPPVVTAALFGSVARRESTPESDIDLVLVVADGTDTDAEAWKDQVRGLQTKALAWTGNRLELITVAESQLATLVTDPEPIVAEWRTDAVTLAGRDLRDMLDQTTQPEGNS